MNFDRVFGIETIDDIPSSTPEPIPIPSPTPTPEPTPNQPPIADTGGPYKSFVNKSVQLNGSGSYDLDGQIMKYLWEYGNKTKTGPKVNFTFKQNLIIVEQHQQK